MGVDSPRQRGISEYVVQLKMRGRRASLLLMRHLSPITSERLFRSLPLLGTAIRLDDVLYISLELEGRLERPVKSLKTGEVGFSPSNKVLVIAMKDVDVGIPLTMLGRIVEGIEELSQINTGDRVTLEKRS